MTTKSVKVIKVSAALNEFKQLQTGAIRTHIYRIESIQGEETLKTGVEKNHTLNLLDFSLHLLLQRD